MPLIAKDFVPEKTKGGVFKSGKIENFEKVIEAVNQWKAENPSIQLLNVETVVLPNIHDAEEEGSQDTELWTGGQSSSQWYQLIRVWYNG